MLCAVNLIVRISQALTSGPATVVIEPPGTGPGFWAGGPSVVNTGGDYHLAYRLRRPVDQGRGYANVVASSTDGLHFTPVATVLASTFECASLERPALIQRPDGGWRLYVSCSTPGSKHWWVEAIDTPAGGSPADLENGVRTVVLPGDNVSAWKDVVVARDGELWQMWACEHLLDEGDDQADRMRSVYLTSTDGLLWTADKVALAATPQTWDGRGARITSAWESDGKWIASYDGRASAAENWFERTGFAVGAGPDDFVPVAGPFDRDGRTLRYVTIARTADGLRLYFEAEREDGANNLRTVFLPFAA
jgi:hypothetical protein